MKRMVALSCLVLGFVAFDANAVVIAGAGTGTCGTWTKERQEKLVGHYAQTSGWVIGYLRGYFDGRGLIQDSGKQKDPMQQLGNGPGDAIEAWLDKYCRENPLEQIFMAAYRLAPGTHSAIPLMATTPLRAAVAEGRVRQEHAGRIAGGALARAGKSVAVVDADPLGALASCWPSPPWTLEQADARTMEETVRDLRDIQRTTR